MALTSEEKGHLYTIPYPKISLPGSLILFNVSLPPSLPRLETSACCSLSFSLPQRANQSSDPTVISAGSVLRHPRCCPCLTWSCPHLLPVLPPPGLQTAATVVFLEHSPLMARGPSFRSCVELGIKSGLSCDTQSICADDDRPRL